MKLIISLNEYEETVIAVVDNNARLLLIKTVSETIEQVVKMYEHEHELSVQKKTDNVYIVTD